jgi:hypothetical protein
LFGLDFMNVPTLSLNRLFLACCYGSFLPVWCLQTKVRDFRVKYSSQYTANKKNLRWKLCGMGDTKFSFFLTKTLKSTVLKLISWL